LVRVTYSGSTPITKELRKFVIPIRGYYVVFVNDEQLLSAEQESGGKRKPIFFECREGKFCAVAKTNKEFQPINERKFSARVETMFNAKLRDISGNVLLDGKPNIGVEVNVNPLLKMINITGSWYLFLKKNCNKLRHVSEDRVYTSAIADDSYVISQNIVDSVYNNFLALSLYRGNPFFSDSFYDRTYRKFSITDRRLSNICTIPLVIDISKVFWTPLTGDPWLKNRFCENILRSMKTYDGAINLSGKKYVLTYSTMDEICKYFELPRMLLPAIVVYRMFCMKIDREYLGTGRHSRELMLNYLRIPRVANSIVGMNPRFGSIDELIAEFDRRGVLA
jgi:hypothetical protein